MTTWKRFAGAIALLCSSAGMAASVTVVPSTTTPPVGSSFTITVHGDDFPVVAGATLRLFFNPNVQVTAIGLAPNSPFTGGTVPEIPPGSFASGELISVLSPLLDTWPPPAGAWPSGSFDAFTVTFNARSAGPAGINLFDDGSDICWSEAATFACVANVSYQQANIVVCPDCVPGSSSGGSSSTSSSSGGSSSTSSSSGGGSSTSSSGSDSLPDGSGTVPLPAAA